MAQPYGFCLAGGYAVQAHGMVHRQSKDVDLFTSTTPAAEFRTAVDAVVAALEADGLKVAAGRRGPTFVRLDVVDPAGGEQSVLELDFPHTAVDPYALSAPDVDLLCRRLLDWADDISGRRG
jgi:hypothetical protein